MTRRTSILRRLRRDQRGLSAVEFALLAPVIIAFYFGLAEFCQGYMAQKRMGHVAAMVADLVSQTDVVQAGEVDDIFEIGGLIMKPFSAAPLKQRVASLTRGANGRVTVDWVRGADIKGNRVRAGDLVTDVPTGVIDKAGESVIRTEATYDYDSPVDYLMPRVTQFSHTYYLRPRISERVAYSGG